MTEVSVSYAMFGCLLKSDGYLLPFNVEVRTSRIHSPVTHPAAK